MTHVLNYPLAFGYNNKPIFLIFRSHDHIELIRINMNNKNAIVKRISSIVADKILSNKKVKATTPGQLKQVIYVLTGILFDIENSKMISI